jgi:hypothetical protein
MVAIWAVPEAIASVDDGSAEWVALMYGYIELIIPSTGIGLKEFNEL